MKRACLQTARVICSSVFLILALVIPPKSVSQSLLWKITGKIPGTTSYLYGTIHIKNQRIFEWQDSIYARLSLCRTFAGELDLSADNLNEAMRFMMLPEGQTLHDRFTSSEYQIINEAIKSCSGHELALFDRLKPASLVALCFSGDESYNLEATVDELLYRKAVEYRLDVIGIETVEEQAALIDKIPDSYVVEYFKNISEREMEFEKLVRCYRRADLDSLLLLIQEEESGSLLNDELIRVRNYRMTERIIPLINRHSTFIAIGSGHLPGSEGVIALLRKEGFEVEPVRIY